MRFEFTETSDLKERVTGRDWRDFLEDQNDIVQDIPDDVAFSMADVEELEPGIQDIPDDMDWGKDLQDILSQKIEDKFAHKDTNDGVAKGDLNEVMEDFKPENWEGLSDAERKEALENLGDYVAKDLDLKNPPEVKFYQGEPNEYGYYTADENAIYINECNMSDPIEAADTISHETRHCWQHERADHPVTEQDYAFRDNFANYISPDIDFQAYEDQIVEADAREYADKYRQMIQR